jgi:HEAT repeat protein
VIARSHRHDPVYQHKRLSKWINELESDELDSAGLKSSQAVRAIREIGTNAVPYLVQSLRASDSPLQTKLVQWASVQNIVRLPFRPLQEHQSAVLKAFYFLGADAKSAIPALNKLLNSPRTSYTAITALFGIGNEAVPALTEVCNHTNPSVRSYAALVLSVLRRGGDLVSTAPTTARINSIQLPPFSFAFAEEDILSVTDGLYDPQPGVRRASAEALVAHSFAPKPSVVTARLLELLMDSDKAVREATAKALKIIDPDAAAKAGVK